MSPARILIVEDNAMNRLLVKDILEYRGHRVVEAENVAEALSRIAESPPDLIVTDYQMPGGSGEALLRAIRARPTLAHIPILVVTASVISGDRARLLSMGFDGFIGKPIDTQAFGPMVESYLGGRPPAGGPMPRA